MKPSVKASHFLPHYSGPQSTAFWALVTKANDRTLYSFACAIQDAESRMLRSINEIVDLSPRRQRTRKRVTR